MRPFRGACEVVCLAAVFALSAGLAQSPTQADTNAKPLTEKAIKAKEKARRKELSSGYETWLKQDVAWIITPEEEKAFRALQNDEEREQFIEQFWLRRDPTPDTEENEFKEEHYRRMAYANERFASGIPGWKTDRGQIYIKVGPPDEIDDHSSGGFYERPPEEGGGSTSAYPFQRWRYRHIDGVGDNIVILFVDNTMSGEFHITSDPSEIDALTYVPNAGLSLTEQLGLSDKSQRFSKPDGTHLPMPFGGAPESMNEFTRLETVANLMKVPTVRLPDFEQVTTTIHYNQLPFKVRVDYFPVTNASVLAAVTVQFENRDLQFQSKDGGERAQIEISGRIDTITRRRVATPFDDAATLFVPQAMFAEYAKNKSIYQKVVPLRPGQYRLTITARDGVAGAYAFTQQALNVPQLDPDRLTASSLVLADILEPVPPKEIGSGPFVIGEQKVRPRVDNVFRRDERIGIYLSAYNFAAPTEGHTPSGRVTYEFRRADSNELIASDSDDISQFAHASLSQTTIQKFLKLDALQLAPGAYTLTVRIADNISGQETTASTKGWRKIN